MADLDHKLTGEKTVAYVSDSDGDNDVEGTNRESDVMNVAYDGPQTGPKGVLEDYKQYKNLCQVKELQATKEKVALHKKLAFTADPNKHPDKELEKESDEDEFDFEDDEFIKEYHHKRLEQMQKATEEKFKQNMLKFGTIVDLQSSDELLDSIEKEQDNVIVVIHLYDQSVPACIKLNECLECLAKQYTHMKFCKILTTKAGLSLQFKLSALPTIQVYKGGSLIGNYIKMQEHLDKIFYTADVENFLIESDIIPSVQNMRNNYDDFDIVDDDDDE